MFNLCRCQRKQGKCMWYNKNKVTLTKFNIVARSLFIIDQLVSLIFALLEKSISRIYKRMQYRIPRDERVRDYD